MNKDISVGIQWCTLRSGKSGIAFTAFLNSLSVLFLVVILTYLVTVAVTLVVAFFAITL